MTEAKANSRLEAFCDGVFAIAITLLIIEVKIPPEGSVRGVAELWRALGRLAPELFAFVLSFGVILITWVNHHGMFKQLDKTSPLFIYANGLLLLTVVMMPFTASLLGAYLWTDRAVPAVVLYDAALALQAAAWLFLTGTALRGGLIRNEAGEKSIRESYRSAYFALGLYTLLALLAFRLPHVVAVATTATWVVWLVLSIRMKHT
jgi:uncharacterized membrane protein